jgi:prepilin-type N-terminal cleavage/methylation domain-containing protein/prepilin-type processing-associated H-X9-DG protein
MRTKPSRWSIVSSRGFTLIEVLVVVAIIALLISILLPSLAAARRVARTVACRADIHQMGLAMTMYNNQYGYFPGHHLASPTPTQFILWPLRLMRSMKGSGGKGSSGQHQVYWCPSSKYKRRWDGRQRLWSDINSAQPNDCANFDYGYNDWGIGETYNIAGAPNLGLGGHVVADKNIADQKRSGEVRLQSVKRPADMIVIADNDSDDLVKGQPGNWDTAIDPIDDSGREWPGARHDKGCNVLWADGHADFQLQARLVEKTHKARRRWNNDFRAHCQLWGDGKHTGHPEENVFNR